MKILFAASEALPFYKTGGLADVARALPDALAQRGHDVRIILPGYSFLGRTLADAALDLEIAVPWPGGDRTTRFLSVASQTGAPATFVTVPGFFDTDAPYDPVGGDYWSLGRRFAFFSRAVVAFARHWGADVVHANDWPTGLVPLYALTDSMPAATLFSIHNLAYQGNFRPGILRHIGVPDYFQRVENGLEFHGDASFMKGGVALADRLATVSPTYAREIQTPAYGVGLDGLLHHRRRVLHGVLNGIDADYWNPATDTLLPATYTARTLATKSVNRSALRERSGITADGPVFGIVSRLAHQKGIDLLIAAMPAMLEGGATLVVLGSGEPGFEHALAQLASRFPDRVALRPGFDEPLAHLIYAGADFFLMPSYYEPCGLGQMIAQRYGTPPIGRRTGGLSDTIEDGATGFLFDDPEPDGLLAAASRAMSIWERRGWRALQTRCMREDHSWTRSASEYETIYRLALGSLAP